MSDTEKPCPADVNAVRQVPGTNPVPALRQLSPDAGCLLLRRPMPDVYEFTRPDLGRDYHARLEEGVWVVDVFDSLRSESDPAYLRTDRLEDLQLPDLILHVLEDDGPLNSEYAAGLAAGRAAIDRLQPLTLDLASLHASLLGQADSVRQKLEQRKETP